jgi:hypothetical protein
MEIAGGETIFSVGPINKKKMPGTGQNGDWSLFLGNNFEILGNLALITGAWRLLKGPW